MRINSFTKMSCQTHKKKNSFSRKVWSDLTFVTNHEQGNVLT